MIGIGSLQIATDDPRLWAAAIGVVLFLILLRSTLSRRTARSSRWRGTSPTSTARSGR